jgi:hypothetical protein
MSLLGGIASGIGGALAGSLFGGDNDSDVKTGTMPRWTPEQMKLLQQATELLSKGPRAETAYPGALPGTEGITNIENLSLSGLETLLGGDNLLAQQQAALSQRMNPEARAREVEDYFQEAVAAPMMETYREDILPGISRRYAPSGFWSSERLRTEENATEDLLDALTQARTGLAYQERQDALTAMGMVPESVQGQASLYGAGLGAGEQLRGIERAGRGAEYSEWLRTQPDEEEWLAEVMGILGLSPYDSYAFAEQGQEGLLSQLSGGLIGGFAPKFGEAAADYLFGTGGTK